MLPLIKVGLSAIVILAASEAAKRNLALAALLCALPFTSLLTLSWTWFETPDTARITALSHSILAYTLPSLVFFVLLPWALRLGLGFWPSLAVSAILTAGFYRLCEPLLARCAA